MSMKNSIDTIGNRTSDLPAFSTVPQPTPPPRTPKEKKPGRSVGTELILEQGVRGEVTGRTNNL
jgi:hypothetical protein